MPALLTHPTARFVALTAVLGSLADWTLFAALVAVVDERTAGSPWATTAVLLARVLPALAFAPIAARRVDASPLRAVLPVHELGRVAAVGVLAFLAPTGPIGAVVLVLLGLEFAAAMLAAGREALISRHVPGRLHPATNTATVVASFGLLPVGALVVQGVGPGTAILLAAGAQAVVLASYLLAWPRTDAVEVPAEGGATSTAASADPTGEGLRRTILGAAIGLAPVVAAFTVAPRLAEHWLGDATATALPTGLLLAGGAVGLALANRRGRAELGLLAAAGGFAVAALGLWQVGLAVVGLGAGLGYLSLQTRLQGQASDPSQFAAAFAVLKASTIVGTLAGPVLWGLADRPTELLWTAVGAAALAAAVAGGVSGRAVARTLLRRVVLAVVVVEEEGQRLDGPAVVVSNHPNAIDGVVAMAADPTMRPIAKRQAHPIARLGIWLGECVVTDPRAAGRPGTPSAFAAAEAHLRGGGRIWLAPEGGAHTARTLRPPRTGAVRMAAAAEVPVQALGIHHAGDAAGPRLRDWRPWRRPRVVLRWGEVVAVHGEVDRDVDVTMAALARAADMAWEPVRERSLAA